MSSPNLHKLGIHLHIIDAVEQRTASVHSPLNGINQPLNLVFDYNFFPYFEYAD